MSDLATTFTKKEIEVMAARQLLSGGEVMVALHLLSQIHYWKGPSISINDV
jgi:hypothetical protein